MPASVGTALEVFDRSFVAPNRASNKHCKDPFWSNGVCSTTHSSQGVHHTVGWISEITRWATNRITIGKWALDS